jgi:hypothetical protein
MKTIRLRSGLEITNPAERLLRFCREEYDYYDGVPNGHPDRIEPLDVLATVGLNSRIDTAVKVRTVHRGMAAACDPLLPQLPRDADLLTFEPLDPVHELFAAAMTSKYVFLSAACKVLHRKRPWLIPVLDGVVVGHYLGRLEERTLLARSWESRPAAAEAGRLALLELREDLDRAQDDIEELREGLKGEGFPLSHVRVLDILVWTETETAGSYRV